MSVALLKFVCKLVDVLFVGNVNDLFVDSFAAYGAVGMLRTVCYRSSLDVNFPLTGSVLPVDDLTGLGVGTVGISALLTCVSSVLLGKTVSGLRTVRIVNHHVSEGNNLAAGGCGTTRGGALESSGKTVSKLGSFPKSAVGSLSLSLKLVGVSGTYGICSLLYYDSVARSALNACKLAVLVALRSNCGDDLPVGGEVIVRISIKNCGRLNVGIAKIAVDTGSHTGGGTGRNDRVRGNHAVCSGVVKSGDNRCILDVHIADGAEDLGSCTFGSTGRSYCRRVDGDALTVGVVAVSGDNRRSGKSGVAYGAVSTALVTALGSGGLCIGGRYGNVVRERKSLGSIYGRAAKRALSTCGSSVRSTGGSDCVKSKNHFLGMIAVISELGALLNNDTAISAKELRALTLSNTGRNLTGLLGVNDGGLVSASTVVAGVVTGVVAGIVSGVVTAVIAGIVAGVVAGSERECNEHKCDKKYYKFFHIF